MKRYSIDKQANVYVWLLLAFIPLLCGTASRAENAAWVNNYFGLTEGLPHLRVNTVLQDKLGFIWTGTQGGLSRFDGQNFRNYTTKNSELPSNNVTALFETQSGTIWVGTDKGLLHLKDGQLRLVYSYDESVMKIHKFFELSNGNLFIGTDKNVLVNNKVSTQVIKDLPYPAYSFIQRDKDIYIGSQGKLLKLVDGATLKIIEFPEANEDLKVNDFYFEKNNFMVATDNGLYELKDDKLVKLAMVFSDDRVRKLIKSENMPLLVAAQSGLYQETDPGKFEQIKKVFGINDFIIDRENTIWLASNDFGLISLWPGWVKRYSLDRGLPNAATWSIAQHEEGAYWVGSSGGLHMLKNGFFKQAFPEISEPVYSLHMLTKTKLLVGTRQGLLLADVNERKIEKRYDEVTGLQINGFFSDRKNQLWILTTEGVFLHSNEKLIPFPSPHIRKKDVRTMYHHSQGEYWFGGREGLFSSDESNVKIPTKISANFITSIFSDNANHLWLTTYDNGLHVFDGKWHQVSTKNGLLSDSLFNIEQKNGYYWLSSFSGLFRVAEADLISQLGETKETLSAEAILSEEQSFFGAQRSHCCHGVGGSKLLAEDKNLWYVTNDGVVEVLTDRVKKNTVAPISQILSIATDNEFYNTIYMSNSTLRLNGRNVSIRLSSSSYRDPQSNRYLAKVSGVHENWVDLGANGLLLIPNLSPGTYQLEVKSSNNSGVFSAKPTSIKFVISGAVAESRWFKIALLTLAVLLFYLIYGVLKARSLTLVVKMKENVDNLELENDQLMKKISVLENFIDHHVFEDQLTGAYTMRFLEHQLSMDIPYYERIISLDTERVSIVFIMIDIDDFKQVNIKYSRSIGDLILQQITNLIKRAIRESDYVVRINNDKFIIVFRPILEEDIPTVTERIRKQVERCKFEINEDEFLKVTSSISFADYPIFPEVAHKLPWRSLLELTERGLNEAKEAGGNRWIGYQLKESVLDKAKASKTPIDIYSISEDNFQEFKSWAKTD